MRNEVPLWRAGDVSQEPVDGLVRDLDIPERVARWLVVRGMTSKDEARRFLFWREQLSNPFDFHEMRSAIERIIRAISTKETVAIVGDYDVDGVTASAILASELDARGARWHCLIPERVNDGYGLSTDLIRRAKALGAHLVVTVDNGIRADDAIKLANELGIDVIITDHHEPGETVLPNCDAVVHYSRHASPTEAIVLSGAGVAWKLTQALESVSPRERHGDVPDFHEEWLLGLTALGAISDMMPMRAENRRIIREGLAALRRCQRPGWLALSQRARVGDRELSVTDISWRIAPRLNAAGRMAHADTAFALLMAKQRKEAIALADEIEALNAERRRATEQAALEAVDEVKRVYGDAPSSGIVVCGPWPLGVVGIVAAKLVDRFGCPAIVFADIESQALLRGSGRAPEGSSLHAMVERCAEYLDHFGGHDAAIGCGIKREQFEAFRNAFAAVSRNAYSQERTPDSTEGDVASTKAFAPIADDYMPLDFATVDTLDWVLRFAPHGPENEPLRFFLGPSQVAQMTPMGDGSHVRLKVLENRVERDLVWFNAPEFVQQRLERGRDYAFVVEMSENLWQGKRQIQLRVVDGWRLEGQLSRDDFADVYRMLNEAGSLPAAQLLASDSAPEKNMRQMVLDIFVELGFAAYREGAYHVVKSVKRDLRDARLYQLHLRDKLIRLDADMN